MNLLLLSLDTTRADHLGCYGWPRATSPHLDRLAEEGTLFESCFSPSIPTHPAHTSLLTGCDVMRHQIVAQGGKNELSPDLPLLAEILRRRGYWTGAADNLGRWFSRGFDRYEGYQWARDPEGGWRKGEAVTAAALRVLNEAASQPRPFFLFVHYWDAHTPYLPPAPYERMFYEGGNERDPANRSMDPVLNFPPFESYFRKWWDGVTDIEFPKAQYDGAIAYLDSQLRRLFGRLDELGLRESTLVVITSDHGEELDEHQMWFDHH
ncbi:MAG TPA: sulfatase, partial [Armatimonadota bacterium]|nr:sulfatase [Armatimonadota bacterium]